MGEHESEAPTRVADSADGRGPGPALVDRSMVQKGRSLRRHARSRACIHTVHLHSRTYKSPIALVRVLWFGHASAFRDYLMLVLALGVSWYRVALNVDSWRRDRTVLTFTVSSPPTGCCSSADCDGSFLGA
jgi:hypothetical protein